LTVTDGLKVGTFFRHSVVRGVAGSSHQTFPWTIYRFVRRSVQCIVEQVAQLCQRDRASSIDDFKGWVNVRLNFRLKGYFLRHCDMTQFTLTYSIMSMFTFWMAPCDCGRSDH